MTNPPTSRTDDYFIYSYYCNKSAKIRISAIAQLLQESAWLHAESCDLGYTALKKQGLLWVLSGLRIKILDLPAWGENLKLKTWGRGYDSLFAYRDFKITDQNQTNNKIEATSSWLIINEENRRPKRIVPEMQKIIPYDNPLNLANPSKIQILKPPYATRSLVVLFSDIDVYNHVNNTRYIQWCIDSLSDYHKEIFRISEFEIRFISETHLNDEVEIEISKDERSYYFKGINRSNTKDIFHASLTYHKL